MAFNILDYLTGEIFSGLIDMLFSGKEPRQLVEKVFNVLRGAEGSMSVIFLFYKFK